MNKNKYTLITTAATIGVIAFAVASMMFTDSIPLPIVIGLLTLVEIFYVVPKTVSGYFKLHGEELESKWLSFVPIFNYSMIMNPIVAIIYFITVVLFILGVVLVFFPQLSMVLGENFALGFQDIMPNITIILFMLNSIVIGVGLYMACNTVTLTYNKMYKNSGDGVFTKVVSFIYTYLPFMYIIILSLPVIRCVALLLNLEKLQSLNMTNITVYNVEEFSGGY